MWIKPDFESILPELKARPNWVLARAVERDGKITRPPFQPNGILASHSSPSTWSSFDAVKTAYEHGGVIGVILLARACVTRAAGLTGEDDAALWVWTLEETAALLDANRKSIGGLAALLMEKTQITRRSRGVKKILANVEPGDGVPLASLALIERLSEVRAFLAEVRE